MSSGVPFGWASARAPRAASAAGTPAAGTTRSAPETCAPPAEARILTQKRGGESMVRGAGYSWKSGSSGGGPGGSSQTARIASQMRSRSASVATNGGME